MLLIYLAMLETPEDKQKMTELYMTYREYLLKVAYKVLHNQEDAEDVLHQAFERIVRDFTKIGDVSSRRTRNFLVIIVRGLAINLYNEHKKVTELSFEDLDEFEDAFVVEDQTLAQINYEALREVLEQLPAIHRDMLYLTYFEELSIKEISKFLALTEVATQKRLERARQALQKSLSREGVCAG